MPCTICGQIGHNRRTCTQNNEQSNGSAVSGNGYQQPGWLQQQFLGVDDSNSQSTDIIDQRSSGDNQQSEHHNQQSEHHNQQSGNNTEYTEQQLHEFKTISDNTDNFKLKQLPKYTLIKICIHYDIPRNRGWGKKIIISEIINHRCHLDEHDGYVQPQNMSELVRYFTRKFIFGTPDNYRIIGSFNMNDINHIICKLKYHNTIVAVKSELVILYKLLLDYIETGHSQTEHNIWSDLTRHQVYSGLIALLGDYKRRLESEIPTEPPSSQEYATKSVKNLTSQNIYLYWSVKRNDSPDYSECNFLCKIKPGLSREINYHNQDSFLIVSDYYSGMPHCYYLDLKEKVIFENKFSTPGHFEIKINKKDIEKWKEAALKCDFLIKELKRLGIEKNDNFACIVDMHQDITIPDHSEVDKELAGIPSTLTNIT